MWGIVGSTYYWLSTSRSSSDTNFLLILLQGDEEEIKAIREKILELRKAIHQRTEEEVSRRWGYEEGVCIHRILSYFEKA